MRPVAGYRTDDFAKDKNGLYVGLSKMTLDRFMETVRYHAAGDHEQDKELSKAAIEFLGP